jgi:uncharacterized protein (DUF2141 family)
LWRWLWLAAALALVAGVPATTLAVTPCGQATTRLLVQVHGVRNGHGSLVAILYGDRPDDFLRRKGWLDRERVPARAGSVALCLQVPRPGLYAVAVYHDENDNRRFDRGWTGLPSEGYGVSNNPRPVLRAPTHDESVIEVGAGSRVVHIELRY